MKIKEIERVEIGIGVVLFTELERIIYGYSNQLHSREIKKDKFTNFDPYNLIRFTEPFLSRSTKEIGLSDKKE